MDGSVWDSIVALCLLTAYLVQVSTFKYSLASSFWLQRSSTLPPWFSTFLPAISRVLNLHNASFGDSFLTLILRKIACGVSLHGAGVTGPSICRKDGNHMGVWTFRVDNLLVSWTNKTSITSIWVSISDIWPSKSVLKENVLLKSPGLPESLELFMSNSIKISLEECILM